MILCKREYVIQMVMDRLNDEHNMIAKVKTLEEDGTEGKGIILYCCNI